MKKKPTLSPHLELVDVVDENDHPLIAMPLPEVFRQTLKHRTVLVLLHDSQGRIYLQKRGKGKTLYPGRWDLSATGHVKAGEARKTAARRELQEELSVYAQRLLFVKEVQASAATGYSFVTLYRAEQISGEITPDGKEVVDGMFVDRDELDSMVESFRDLLTPALVYFWELDLIFPKAD